MRTTIDIDDPILKKIKAIQARDGRSLGRLVSDLLAQALASEVKEAAPQYFAWTASAGALRVDLANRGRQRVLERFSWERAADALVDFYRQAGWQARR